MKAPTEVEHAIDQRLDAQQSLLIEMAQKQKELMMAVAKLLVRNEDITALEGIIASNESLQQSLPLVFSKIMGEHDQRIAGFVFLGTHPNRQLATPPDFFHPCQN